MTEERLRFLEARYFERLKETHDYSDIYTIWVQGRSPIHVRIKYLEDYLGEGV